LVKTATGRPVVVVKIEITGDPSYGIGYEQITATATGYRPLSIWTSYSLNKKKIKKSIMAEEEEEEAPMREDTLRSVNHLVGATWQLGWVEWVFFFFPFFFKIFFNACAGIRNR
jgi:hypothetical protein